MSTEPVGYSFARARVKPREPVAIPVRPEAQATDESLAFVRFCYRRRRVSWPALYDEMAAVAARGAYRGLGFAELAERGVCFSLRDLPRLAALTEQVMLEERHSPEPKTLPRDESEERSREEPSVRRLTMLPARG